MRIFIFKSTWSPYVAGALAGLLAVGSVVATTKYLGNPKYMGSSTSFVRAVAMIEQQVDKKHVEKNEYFQAKGVKVDWQMAFVGGIFFGALLSAMAGGTFKFEAVPDIWQERFGGNIFKRAVGSFIGGVIVLFGVRLAGGCPSGHGLSGMMQLSLSGAAAMIAFMIGGIITANLLYKRSW